MPPKGLRHKRELAARKRRKKNPREKHITPLKTPTARKRGGEIFTIKPAKRRYAPVAKKRGPGKGQLERELDRVKKEIARKSDDDAMREALRGPVGEVVAQIAKPGVIVMFVRNKDGGLDRRERSRTYA